MLEFIMQNLATLLISAVLLAVIVLIVAGMVRNRKKGKSAGCGCGCESCPSTSICHKQ